MKRDVVKVLRSYFLHHEQETARVAVEIGAAFMRIFQRHAGL
jgi:hypothetical protein